MAALNTGKNLLYLIFSIMIALIVVAGLASAAGIRKITASIWIPDRVFQNEKIEFLMTITNNGILPSFYIQINDKYAQFHRICPLVRHGEELSVREHTRFSRRGMLDFEYLTVSCDFPFGFFEFRKRIPFNHTIIVYPAYDALDGLPSFMTHNPHEIRYAATRRAGSGSNYLGLREHRPEDGLARVHWKSSAKLGKFVVREYEKEGEYSYIVVIDPSARAMIVNDDADEGFEQGIRLAAAVCDYIVRKNYELRVLWPEISARPLQKIIGLYPVLDAFAKAQPHPILTVSRILSAAETHLSPGVFLIVIATTFDDSLNKILLQAALRSVRSLVLVPQKAIHSEQTYEQWRRAGIPVHLARHESEITHLPNILGA